jgi:hypothetical protein
VQGNVVNSPLQWRSTRADLPKCFMLESAELSDQEKTQVDVFIASLNEVDSSSRLGRTDKLSLDIDTGSTKPFKQRQFPMSPYLLEALCSASIQYSTSRLPSRPWFVYQKWNPVGHGQEVTEGMVGEKKKRAFSFCFPPSPEARRVLCVQSVLFKNLIFVANSHCNPLLN